MGVSVREEGWGWVSGCGAAGRWVLRSVCLSVCLPLGLMALPSPGSAGGTQLAVPTPGLAPYLRSTEMRRMAPSKGF